MLFSLLPVLSGCFSLREPDKPVSDSSWNTPYSVKILLEDMQTAMKTLNVNNFQRCLNERNFKFTADPTVSGNNLGNFSNWTRNDEAIVLTNILNFKKNVPVNTNNSLTFTASSVPSNSSVDSAEYSYAYELRLFHADGNYPYTDFRGNATFTIVRSANNDYSIVAWRDNRNSSFPCWSELKQHFITL
ncbi:MAG: hypothetical protein V4543_15980 [Bacteroidota bacterium]